MEKEMTSIQKLENNLLETCSSTPKNSMFVSCCDCKSIAPASEMFRSICRVNVKYDN